MSNVLDNNIEKESSELSQQLVVSYLNLTELKPYPKNSRKHSKAQIRQIAESIQQFGFTVPILINSSNMILAGHGRVEAAKQLGWATVPCITLSNLSEAQTRAYIIADNRLAENSRWDMKILAEELRDLSSMDLGVGLEITGFELPKIEFMLNDLEGTDPDDGNELPKLPATPVCKTGDLWILGDHRLYCGNSLESASYTALMNGELAQMVFTDPPYNVKIPGNVSGLGTVQHENFAMASGEMNPTQFTNFLREACGHLVAHSVNGSIHYLFMDWRHMGEMLAATNGIYPELKNMCVWAKENAGMGTLYRSQHELVFVFKNGDAPHINNIELGRHGRNRTNVWYCRGVSSLHKKRAEELAMHPTVKPVKLIADALLDCSQRGGLVLDPFGGSGSTLIAAEKTHRKARLIELDPKYCDVMIERWEKFTRKRAINAATGLTLNQTKEQRHEQ